MCDYFWQRMDQNNQGDLTDIFRNGGLPTNDSWHLLPEPDTSFLPPSDIFGDPFAEIGDPLLDELSPAGFMNSPEKARLGEHAKGGIFSRMIQISPATTKLASEILPPPPLAAASTACDSGGGLQISSVRAQGMIKRRKSQVKKVVCIPAPAAASGRPNGTGEVVPSDLWAWRKYGQKPIKGSPYPRGYYRCSSSKGCSARKQVERSRTDPNMLIITYTSEHNHPWPTQRNALAGSTRSQSSKPNNNNSSSMKNNPHHNSNQSIITRRKEEHYKDQCSSSTMQLPKVEEEAYEMDKEQLSLVEHQDHDFDQVFDENFMMSTDSNHHDGFFADFAELESSSSDPMDLIFPKGFMGDHKLNEMRERSKSMDDPFNMFDWEEEVYNKDLE